MGYISHSLRLYVPKHCLNAHAAQGNESSLSTALPKTKQKTHSYTRSSRNGRLERANLALGVHSVALPDTGRLAINMQPYAVRGSHAQAMPDARPSSFPLGAQRCMLPGLAPSKLGHAALDLALDFLVEENEHRDAHNRDGDDPEEGVRVRLRAGEAGEVLAKVADEEGQRQEEDGDGGEDLHGLVLEGAHHVENQVDEVVGGAAHLVERGGDHDAVIFDVAEVRLRYGRDGDGAERLARGDVGVGLREQSLGHGVRLVIAEGIDDA